MAATLPEQPSVTVTRTPRKLTRSHLDRLEHLLIVVPEDFGPDAYTPLNLCSTGGSMGTPVMSDA